jgi:hypothetical protein
MVTFDEFRQNRVMLHASMSLRQENGEYVFGPTAKKPQGLSIYAPSGINKLTQGTIADSGVQKYIILGAIIEGWLFMTIMSFFMFIPGAIEKYAALMIGLVVLVSAMSLPFFIKLVLYDQALTKKRTRFRRTEEGTLIVKNENDEDVVLDDNAESEFIIESAIDRNGNDLYDVWLKRDSDMYYILSDSDRDEMTRLCDALQRVCEFE